MEHLPAGSVLPKTDVKLLSETNAFVAAAEETVEPLKPILWFFLGSLLIGFSCVFVCVMYRVMFSVAVVVVVVVVVGCFVFFFVFFSLVWRKKTSDENEEQQYIREEIEK